MHCGYFSLCDVRFTMSWQFSTPANAGATAAAVAAQKGVSIVGYPGEKQNDKNVIPY